VQRYLLERAVGALIVIFGATLLIFVVLRLSGDPAVLFVSPSATEEDLERVRQHMGLDKPIPVQYALYISRLAVGDFGMSFQHREPAINIVLERIPATLRLAGPAIALIILLAVPLGTLAAVRRGTWIDTLISALTLIGQAVPNFWLGIMLVLLLAVQLRWLPTSGAEGWQSVILPTFTLAVHPCARLMRLVRSELLDVLSQDYVRTARVKGLPERVVLGVHALRNVAIPVVTILGLDLGYLLGGAIIVEAIFAWPGLGNLMVQAINNQDFPVIQAGAIFTAVIIVLLSLITDLVYIQLDPRVRLK
jgi:peptide/nickel transport system permease protein